MIRKRKSDTTTAAAATLLFMSLLLVACITALPLKAAEIYTLNAKVTVDKGIVTLGDLFKDVGHNRATPIFKSPALGKEGTIRLEKLIDIATRFGFTFDTPLNLKAVTVSRPARTVSAGSVEQLIKAELKKQMKLSPRTSLQLSFSEPLNDIKLPLSYQGKFELTNFEYDRASRRFTAMIAPQDAINAAYNKTLFGRASRRETRPIMKRNVKRGEQITSADIELKSFPPSRIAKTAIAENNEIVGMTAARSMKAGSFIKRGDLITPKLVKKNQLVTLLFEKAGLTLKTRGKAMADGELGETVSVLNIQSKRVVVGIIKSAGVIAINDTGLSDSYRKTAQLN